MTPKPKHLCDGDTFELDGLNFRVTFPHDSDMGEPWKEHDGHGIVSDWTMRDKRAGEKVLASDRHQRRYYDIQGTMELALRDGWGPQAEGKTRRQNAAAAVEADFARMKAWCDDEWTWIGVCVQLLDVDGNDVQAADARESLWGIESDAGDYLTEVALELAGEIAARYAGRDSIETKIRR